MNARPLHAASVALALGAIVPAGPASAQAVEGRVVEVGSERPIPGAVVEIVGAGLVTVTDVEGRFGFHSIRADADSVRISRLGYRTRLAYVEFDAVGDAVFRLERTPLELEGVTAAWDFADRMALLDERLDARLGEWPGHARVAGAEDLRGYDDEWERDPWKFLHYGPLKVTWQWNETPWESDDEVYVRRYGVVKPEVWLDDRQVWLQVLIETPNESLCRVETYMPKIRPFWPKAPQDPEPPPQIRAYTCSFMARVAIGQAEMCPVLQWGRLISGPEAGGRLQAVSRRAAVRPPESITPIDLGPDLDLSVTATGVGSGACL